MSYYYTRDHLGSVREMLNGSGAIVARYSYDPYGKTTLVSGTDLATKQYAGYYVHQTSRLEFALYRAYDSNTGRWINRDPIEEGGGVNLYGYAGDNPETFIDPSGLWYVPPPPLPPPVLAPVVLVVADVTIIVYDINQLSKLSELIHAQQEAAEAKARANKMQAECDAKKKVTCKIVSIEEPNMHGLARIDVECSDGSSYFFFTGNVRSYRVGQSMPSKNPTAKP